MLFREIKKKGLKMHLQVTQVDVGHLQILHIFTRFHIKSRKKAQEEQKIT